jgi:hypothetical protein
MNSIQKTLSTALSAACLSAASLTLATSAIAAPGDAFLEAIRTAHAGFNLGYNSGPWQWRGGYVLQNIQRSAVDDVIRSKNKTPYNLNHTLMGEVGYKMTRNTLLFTRGQVMSNQFLTEVPFLYNSLTSQRFNQRYGLLSIGLVASVD